MTTLEFQSTARFDTVRMFRSLNVPPMLEVVKFKGRRSQATRTLLTMGLIVLSAVRSLAQIPDIEAKETPLHWAAQHGLYSIAERLMGNGAAVSAADHFGRTPLHLAVPYADVVALLLDSGARPNAPDMFGRTPLHAALQYPATVALLIDAGADITATDFMGDTALERTLRYGTRSRNLAVIDLLLAAGAGAPQKDR